MATTVTVPGALSTTISNTYNTPYNLEVAQQIASLLALAKGHERLFVSNIDQSPAAVPQGDVGEIAVTVTGGGVINVPTGYEMTAIDHTVTGAVTINGGGGLFAGDLPVTYYGAPSPIPVFIAAGDGNDLIGLPGGTIYDVGLGNGNDTVFANGSGTVTGGTGNNLIFADSAGGNNIVNSYGGTDTIVAGQGAVTVNTYGADPLVFGGSGQMIYVGGAAGSPTVTGGTGTETLFGGAGQNLTYTDGGNTATDVNILAAGAGNETLNAGSAQYGVQMAAGSGSVDMIGTTGNDVFYGGSGAATMTGNGGADGFIFGNVTGQTGGTDIITDFSGADTFVVVGYGPNAAQAALNAATVAGGNTVVKLTDNTTIVFLDVANPNSIANRSY
jgi:Ca2+-binding RTX toxin-like protein